MYQYRLTAAGEEIPVKNRRRLHKIRRVALVAGSSKAETLPDDPFLLGARQRRWPAIAKRYGPTAEQQALELARAGFVLLMYEVDDLVRLARPIGWALTPEADQRRLQLLEHRRADRDQLQARAARLVKRLGEYAPEVAAALRDSTRRHESVRLLVLIHAAEDLLDGVTHDGPRAFSQAHFGSTKLRADAATMLSAVGIPEKYLVELGLVRASRFGVAGVVACIADHDVRLDLLVGPVLVVADRTVRYRPAHSRAPLVIVENLQAAEAVARKNRELVVVYTAGFPSQNVLLHVGEIARAAGCVALIPDADLGGVRIAEAILSVVPEAELVDIGRYPHRPRPAFARDGVSTAGLRAAIDGPAGRLAHAVLERGYPVEQEFAVTTAVREWLKGAGIGS